MNDRIVYQAVGNLEKLFGDRVKYQIKAVKNRVGDYDCKLQLAINNRKKDFLCIVRKEIREAQIPALLKLNNETERTLLIADTIYPFIKEALRRNEINYIDGDGNIYINDNEVFIFVDKTTRKKLKPQPNRAFTNAGLKVVYNVLVNPELINLPYREIAKTADVALDTINKVFAALAEMNFIIRLNNKERKLHNGKELLNLWIANYNTKLRANIFLGNYRFANKNTNWKDCTLNQQKTLWGGEVAANILTGYLQPEKLILYTEEQINDLLKTLKIVPDEQGNITVYKKFWNAESITNTVPDILVYADLLHTGDPRNIETANIIYNERLKDKFE
ncbi:MAG: type IV toxin-antitoxin system AbiEi family antitoxin [Bacteroidota bacterium]